MRDSRKAEVDSEVGFLTDSKIMKRREAREGFGPADPCLIAIVWKSEVVNLRCSVPSRFVEVS